MPKETQLDQHEIDVMPQLQPLLARVGVIFQALSGLLCQEHRSQSLSEQSKNCNKKSASSRQNQQFSVTEILQTKE